LAEHQTTFHLLAFVVPKKVQFATSHLKLNNFNNMQE